MFTWSTTRSLTIELCLHWPENALWPLNYIHIAHEMFSDHWILLTLTWPQNALWPLNSVNIDHETLSDRWIMLTLTTKRSLIVEFCSHCPRHDLWPLNYVNIDHETLSDRWILFSMTRNVPWPLDAVPYDTKWPLTIEFSSRSRRHALWLLNSVLRNHEAPSDHWIVFSVITKSSLITELCSQWMNDHWSLFSATTNRCVNTELFSVTT